MKSNRVQAPSRARVGKSIEVLIHSLRSRYPYPVGDGIAWAKAFAEEPGLRKLLGAEGKRGTRPLFPGEHGSKLSQVLKRLRRGRAVTIKNAGDELGGFEIWEHAAGKLKPVGHKLRFWFPDLGQKPAAC